MNERGMKTLKKILTLFVSLQLVVAVAGMSVYSHNCSCTNTVKNTFLVENSCCDHAIPAAKSCCEKTAPTCNAHGDCGCQTEVKVFSLNQPFIQAPSLSKVELKEFEFEIVEIYIPVEIPTLSNYTLNLSTEPPPLSGFEITIALCSLKIPIHLS